MASAVERLVEASTRSYVDLIELALEKDPQAAAMGWLNKRATQRVAGMLHDAGLGREAARMVAGRMIPRRGAGAMTSRRTFEDDVVTELDAL